jgi:hypothetical protein
MSFVKILLTFFFLFVSCERLLENTKEYNMQNQNFTQFEGQEVFYVLSKGEILPMAQEKPKTFYVEGWVRRGKFFPKLNKVLGIGDLGTEGHRGWLELNSNEFYPIESGKGAITPFVKGYKNSQGQFIPSEREVYIMP